MSYKSKKHMYLKKEIDSLFHKPFYDKCYVSLTEFTAEEIANYKLSLIKNKDKTPEEVDHISKNNNTLKDNKTSKSDKRSKDDKKSKDVKTSRDDKKSKDVKTSRDDKKSKDVKTSRDDKKSKDVKTPKDDKTTKENTSIDDEPAKKKQKLDTNGIDVLKFVLSREGETHKFKSQFKSSLKLNKEIASTSTAEEVPIVVDCQEPIVIDCEESTTSANSSATNVKQKLWVKDLKKMMDADNYIKWLKIINYKNKPNHPTNGMKKLAVAKLPISGTIRKPLSGLKVADLKHDVYVKKYKKEHLVKIERLYKKYFSKSVQDAIVIIANILNIISISNKHYKTRVDESFKKRSEAEKLKKRCDANRLHGRHKKILETKLKINFVDVVSSFEFSEFDTAFHMFFLSILTVLRVLDHRQFKRGGIFKNVILLVRDSLKNSDCDHPKIFSMFRSKTFQPDCVDLISLIENSQDIDSGVSNRMSLFFVSTVNSWEYFQAVIDAVTGDSNEDLALLIDNATFQCSINSEFKDPIDSSNAQYSDDKIPATQTIPSTINSDEIIQNWSLAKYPDGTFQQIPVLKGNKTQTIGNTAVKPSILTGQTLNTFYQSFSSSLHDKTFEPSTSKVIPTNKCFVVAPTISHSPFVKLTASLSKTALPIPATPTTFVIIKPAVPNNISMANSSLNRAEGKTIIVGNKQYKFVKGPTGELRAVVNKTKTFVKPPPTIKTKCYSRNCTKPVTIMCSSCTSVKYCSNICQQHDWYDGHINDCHHLLNKK
ncbi:uncharacterized protein LOC100574406 [Acyrthosiphon pisum]|uniref:MYND-type domain-containing protein n=1 Tax=Acyrthosiphon pisum TaxID=7029 RepID=A0A8R2D5B0_ACYPI|nr:uncharacterized protein LOC100574406 [Acyrthosiphon pisum]XP_016661301.1 uncharacterized protein LOC100574406 [Acyrthosiphon pisum]|eukprot:XP_016661291.1 PREDICTED: uncharacterized protein LOC100574406 [Acyrthosiphon pisum]